MGRVRFIVFYLLGGIAAFALQFAVQPNSPVPTLGASGAIAAVLGSYLVMFPRARVLTLIFFIIPITLRAEFVLGWWFIVQLFHGVQTQGIHVNGGVAYWAHVGGFVFGMVATWLLGDRVKPRPTTIAV